MNRVMTPYELQAALMMCCVVGSTTAMADISVPTGFAIDTLIDSIDGTTPRLEAIRNPEYGAGVITSAVNNEIVTVLRVSNQNIEVLASFSHPTVGLVPSVKFAPPGLFDHRLYVSVTRSFDGVEETDLFRILPNGAVEQEQTATVGGPDDHTTYLLEFSTGAAGYGVGAYLRDINWDNPPEAMYFMDESFFPVQITQTQPPGRDELDVGGMRFDTTGSYNNLLTLADCENNSNPLVSAIYQLSSSLEWSNLTAEFPIQTHCFQDLAFSSGGVFGMNLYVSDRVDEAVYIIEADGSLTPFASGFTDILSLTISDDGNTMYVSDSAGVYRVRADESVPGAGIVMREPANPPGGVFTNDAGVLTQRILFSEPVLFAPEDIMVTSGDGSTVPFAAVGSNSPFVVITFGEPLLNDIYTIVVSDAVVSAETGAAIDGDGDGEAGGDAVVVLEHRCRTDSDNSGTTDVSDLLTLLAGWGLCP